MRNLVILIFILSSIVSKANFYSLSGYVYDKNNQPIPYANVFVKNTTIATSSDINGKYFLELTEGTYEIVYKMLGYEEKVLDVTIQKNVIKNVWLKESIDDLSEVVVKVSKKDPAYDIIKKTIENKSKYIKQYDALKSEFYIKASETTIVDSSKIKLKEKVDSVESIKASTNMNLVELNGVLHYQYPNNVKEIVEGYHVKGNEDDLFFLSNTEVYFNFYKNLIYSGLTEAPLVSPLNWTAILSYKYKLLEVYDYNGQQVNRIEIKARKNGNALFEGQIHIIEDEWAIHKLDLRVSKKVLNYYDKFRIIQTYDKIDSLWLLTQQDFEYSTKASKKQFDGRTVVYYKKFEINPKYEKRFFSSELGVKTQEAYDRDSTYWNLQRPEPLTEKEQEHVAFIDSVSGVLDSEWYKDSIEELRNAIKPLNILVLGQQYSNWRKKKELYFAPAINMINPISPGGLRVNYFISYYKKFENRKYVYLVPSVSYGVRNEDIKGTLSCDILYDPYHQRELYAFGGREFDLINPYDAYINMFKRSNFFEKDFLIFGHRMELVNGLYLNTSLEWADRAAISNYEFGTISDRIFDDNKAIDFESYSSFSTLVGLDYTPKQKYLREPHEKIVLGSKWPTFSVMYKKGLAGPLGSIVDYDRIELGIKQKHRLGVFGTSEWRAESGKFLTKKELRQVDYIFQRQGDPFLYTDPFNTFQLLPETFPTFDWYVEWHYLHRFNGVIMNKIPFLRKAGIRLVAGQSMLYAFENDFKHVELFGGAERVFRFWRERFRIGVYYAVGNSSTGFHNGFKFSIEYFDKRTQKWNF